MFLFVTVPGSFSPKGSQPQTPQSPQGHGSNVTSPVGVSSPLLLSPQQQATSPIQEKPRSPGAREEPNEGISKEYSSVMTWFSNINLKLIVL